MTTNLPKDPSDRGRLSRRPTTNDLEPFGSNEPRQTKARQTKAQRWRPRSRKAELRRFARARGLPNPPDSLSFLRAVRKHPTILPKEPSPTAAALNAIRNEFRHLSGADLNRLYQAIMETRASPPRSRGLPLKEALSTGGKRTSLDRLGVS